VSVSETVLGLVTDTLDALETDRFALSTVVRRCCRIARLRNDYPGLWWLEYEMIDITDSEQKSEILREIVPHLSIEEFRRYRDKIAEYWIEERSQYLPDKSGQTANEEQVIAKGIGQIELDIAYLRQEAEDTTVPEGLHPVDLYFQSKGASDLRWKTRLLAKKYADVLERIRQKVYNFLSQTEKQLLYGQVHADIFDRNRRYVDLKLGQLCPDALGEFVEAFRRVQDNTPASRAQALTSCRRFLKSLADCLYPPSDQPVVGADDHSRILTNDKYKSRLWQFIHEQTSDSKSGRLLKVQVQDLGNRVDAVHDLACKGVHAEVEEFELNQCLTQMYLLTGDLLRLSEGTSAIGMESE